MSLVGGKLPPVVISCDSGDQVGKPVTDSIDIVLLKVLFVVRKYREFSVGSAMKFKRVQEEGSRKGCTS